MQIVKVSQSSNYRYIPLKGWDSVVAAVNTYANGGARGAQATTNRQIKDVGDSYGGMGLGLYMLGAPHMQGAGNQFVDNLLFEAQGTLAVRDSWKRSYDYDGMGVFFKTSVEIGILNREEEMYYLSIWAAYVGDEPEEGLAEALEIPRSLIGCSIAVEVQAAEDNRFVFDFETILRKLDNVLNVKEMTGEEVAEAIRMGTFEFYPLREALVYGARLSGMDFINKAHAGEIDIAGYLPLLENATGRDLDDEDTLMAVILAGVYDSSGPLKEVLLHSDGELVVTLRTGRVGERHVREGDTKRDTWAFEGSTVSGPLHESWDDDKDFDEPTLVINVFHDAGDQFKHKPIFVPEEKDRALALAEAIAGAFEA